MFCGRRGHAVVVAVVFGACDDPSDGSLRLSLTGAGCARATAPAGGFRIAHVVVRPSVGTRDINLFAGVTGFAQAHCNQPIDLNQWSLVLDAQDGGLDWLLPPGLAIPLASRQPLWLQSPGAVEVILEPAPEPTPTDAHVIWSGQTDFTIPPGTSGYAVKGTCTVETDLDLIAIVGDVRSHAQSIAVSRYDGTSIEEIYRIQAPARPAFVTYDPPLRVAGKGGFIYLCIYDNPGPTPIVFGPDPMRNEHCNVFAYYKGAENQCLEQSGGW